MREWVRRAVCSSQAVGHARRKGSSSPTAGGQEWREVGGLVPPHGRTTYKLSCRQDKETNATRAAHIETARDARCM
eukprot:scaffold31763_cov36-Tisochrysis_lutea.AAC.1